MLTLQELIGKIQEFFPEISTQLLLEASHQPEEDARPSFCFQNVLAKVARDGGSILFGWTFKHRVNRDHGEYLIATHHAVWYSPNKTFIDVTPFTDDTKPIIIHNNVLFLADKLAHLVVSSGTVLATLPLKYFPLSDSPNLMAYLAELSAKEQKACQEIYNGNIDPTQVSGLSFKT